MSPESRRRPGPLGRRASRRDRSELRSVVLSSGLLDRGWIGLQLGSEPADDVAAADALLDADETDGPLSPHPLVELGWARPGQPWLREEVPSLVWWLRARNRREGMSPHPLVDVAAIVRSSPDALVHPGGPLGGWLARAAPDSVLPGPVGAPPVTLAEALAAARAAQRERTAWRSRPPVLAPLAEVEALAAPSEPEVAGLVSVVVVAHDAASDVRRTVASLQAQDHPDWEALVVETGSTDDTAAVLAGLAAFEPRLRVVPTGPLSRAAAQDHAVRRARGRFVAFLDPGRAWAPSYLREAVAHLESDVSRSAVLPGPAGTLGAPRLLTGPRVDPAGLLLRTAAVREAGGLDETLRAAGDQDLLVRLARRDGGLARTPLPAPTGEASTEAGPGTSQAAMLDKHLVDWSGAPTPAPGTTTLVLVARDGVVHTTRWLAEVGAVREQLEGLDVVVVAARPSRTHHVVAATLAALRPGTSVHAVDAEVGPATLANLGIARASGDRVLVVRTGSEAELPALLGLADTASLQGVALAQPVVLGSDDVVVSAGASFAGRLPRPESFLAGHALRDAQTAGTAGTGGTGGPLPLAAPWSPVLALRRSTAATLRGFDATHGSALPEVELGLRAAALGIGHTVLDATVVVRCPSRWVSGERAVSEAVELLSVTDLAPTIGTAPWGAAGFEVVGVRTVPLHSPSSDDDAPLVDELRVPHVVVRPAPPLAERLVEHPPRLRWTIDTAVPAGRGRLTWGDHHFAGSLRDALERQGQVVAVDARDGRRRSGRDHDDVVLVLRGLDLVPPRPGPVHLLWVISHPDLVERGEVARYDGAYAASTGWAARRSAAWGLRIDPLLQATDPTLFHPGRSAVPGSGRVLFVGNSRGVLRTSLRAARAAGVDVEVHGKGWREHLPPGEITSLGIPNADVGRAYASAAVVLNDHWDDMRREGFLSNRLFDAAATGTRVLSDEIEGVRDLLGPLVRTFTDESEVAALIADPEAAWADHATRLERAAVIRAEHSFDHRAETLVADAARILARRLP